MAKDGRLCCYGKKDSKIIQITAEDVGIVLTMCPSTKMLKVAGTLLCLYIRTHLLNFTFYQSKTELFSEL